jgi:hypothetical protein
LDKANRGPAEAGHYRKRNKANRGLAEAGFTEKGTKPIAVG